MTPDDIERLFTRSDGGFLFARWARPIVPVVFGVDDKTLAVVKGAIEAVVALAGHKMAETDPELGSNLMFFFFRDWEELTALEGLEKMVPEIATTVEKLKAQGANQYRFFRFEKTGEIKAGFVFLRMDDSLSNMAAEDLALAQAVQIILLWGEGAFAGQSPLAKLPGGEVILRPEIAGVIAAGYDPVLPGMAQDGAHALRLFARMQVTG
ncbi:hypothetical protein [Marimonas arenosa]|uniref:Uncharacterized protein n=1 Tax=Marimonas arenosa TaxID=1795305 RepID=A0AAE3WFN9_9RHOB|nr:hypothetical protein [Marimonas arenosa]MDQ2091872.1 hypothetical protein [Marimonas arenosa]